MSIYLQNSMMPFPTQQLTKNHDFNYANNNGTWIGSDNINTKSL